MGIFSKVFVYVKERFPVIPLSFLMLGEAASGYLVGYESRNLDSPELRFIPLLLIFLLLFFFQLRIFDDIKDYEIDLKAHPGRPLSRGIINIHELNRIQIIVILIQTIIILIISLETTFLVFLFFTLAQIFSILMRNEFFVKSWIRNHIFVYLVSHQLVVPLVMIIPVLTGSTRVVFTPFIIIYYVRVLIANYTIELTRKTVGVEEERPDFETYSSPKVLGYQKAAFVLIIVSFIEMVPIIWYSYYPNVYWNFLVLGSYGLFIVTIGLYTIRPTRTVSKTMLVIYFNHMILALFLLGLDVWLILD
ncbi:MAG: hypothetical protein IH840_09370 [Candidatus Heimdallarchaeota archaeon]|nr:hypothetical protein [Candidatus Heimdallarchaeota archaeon]